MEADPNGLVRELMKELFETFSVVLLPDISELEEQCIYKVPQKIRQSNPEAYTPRIISIGPFHKDNNNLLQMEKLKRTYYLKEFLNRTQLSVNDMVSKVKEWENKIRSCYSGSISFDSKDFLKIIIVDACFIIEHFHRCLDWEQWVERNDPILSKRELYLDIKGDLILLENQLPFFVLEEIYKLANINIEIPSFVEITIWYFLRFRQNIHSEKLCPKHFTDLLRTLLLPSFHLEQPVYNFLPRLRERFDEFYINYRQPEHVYSASQLLEVGLKFELRKREFLSDLEFDKGVLKMPCFQVSDTTERYMSNIIAFEECHISEKDSYVSQYFSILNFLIKTEKDVNILVDKKIIDNRIGDVNEVATIVNNLCRNARMPALSVKYLSLCQNLNDFYNNPRNRNKAFFIREYFSTPWKIASTITAVLLVLFTFIQTVCSIWSLAK